jgi:hypothetical protein
MELFKRIGYFIYTLIFIIPITALETLSVVGLVNLFYNIATGGDYDMIFLPLCTFGLLLIPLLLDLPRGGISRSPVLAITLILSAPVRILFSLAALIISFISIFYDIGYRPFNDPEIDEGFGNVFFCYLLFWHREEGEGFSFGGGYESFDSNDKLRGILYQLMTLLVVCAPFIIMFLLTSEDIGGLLGAFQLPLVIAGLVFSLALFSFGAVMKGIRPVFKEYEDKHFVIPIPSLSFCLYLLLFEIMPLIQLVTLLVAIFIPRDAESAPCTPWEADIHDEPCFSGDKIKYFFLGISSSC